MNYYSKQREQILEVLKSTYTHPTAYELYMLVHKKYPNISKSTVYRNINVLVNNGDIVRIARIGNTDKYDFIHTNHHHVICTLCGNVFDFEYSFDDSQLISKIWEQTQVDTSLACITIEGICNDCKSQKTRR